MKMRMPHLWILLIMLTWLSSLHIASAYYDPAAQRWLNRDPMLEEAGFNLNRFVLNDSINHLDPDGQVVQAIPMGGIALCLANPACALALQRFLQSLAATAAGAALAEICKASPECQKEWDDARRDCERELAKPWPSRPLTGGYRNIEDCARGLVSEACGGNPVSNMKWPNAGGIIDKNAPPVIRF